MYIRVGRKVIIVFLFVLMFDDSTVENGMGMNERDERKRVRREHHHLSPSFCQRGRGYERRGKGTGGG